MSPPPTKDLYAILGVAEDATPADIKRAYRVAARRFHPDRTGGDKTKEARFKEMSSAYEILSDPEKRRQYDAYRKGPPPGAGGLPFDLGDLFGGAAAGGFRAGGAPGGAAGFGDLGDLFEQVFGGGARGGGGGRVVFESFGGGPGRRRARAPQAPPPAEPPRTETRASDGTLVTVAGADVHSDLAVTIEEAVLGTRTEVATLDGRVTVTVPPGTSSGQRLRLRGKGVHGRGDHYVTVQIVVPREVDARARELLREFCRLAPVRARR